ncbi:hypothetical protein [Endozoicomonas sp. ONNA1]|uniref:hypothetical protein n=1 Tax=Endozoicomonas sp. ONNA1 TaxID=2828740 RepID=UPI0021498F93|nr:hypothetical protein [Endozoicomonas sp. ONNA1]
MATTLLSLYDHVLTMAGLEVYEDDLIGVIPLDNKKTVVCIDKKSLVMPTREVLKKEPTYWEKHIAFHPLSENIFRQIPVVHNKLMQMLKVAVNVKISALAEDLVCIALEKSKHGKFNPVQGELLEAIPDVDKKSLSFLQRVFSASMKSKDCSLVSAYIKRFGRYKGKRTSRVASFDFPLLGQIDLKKGTVMGIRGRQKDAKMVNNIINYILPNNDIIDTYRFGSNDEIACTFHALIMGFSQIFKQINHVVSTFKDYLEDSNYLTTDLSWLGMMDDLTKYDGLIPPLDGNIGVGSGVMEDEGKHVDVAPKTGITEESSRPKSGMREFPTSKPVDQRSNQPLNWDDVNRRRHEQIADNVNSGHQRGMDYRDASPFDIAMQNRSMAGMPGYMGGTAQQPGWAPQPQYQPQYQPQSQYQPQYQGGWTPQPQYQGGYQGGWAPQPQYAHSSGPMFR